MKITRHGRKVHIRFVIDIIALLFNRWTLLVLFLAAAILLTTFPTNNLVIDNNIYYSLATASLIYTAIIAAYDFQIRRNERKLDYAIKFLERFDSEDIRRVRDFTRVIRKNRSNISDQELLNYLTPNNTKDIIKLLKEHGYGYDNKNKEINMERELVFLFNYWQQVYLGIEFGFADAKYLCHNLKGVFDSQYDRFKPWIEKNIKCNDEKQYNDLKKFREMGK